MAQDHEQAPYRVLARKYRPQTFNALIGQAAMVRTLSNAIRTGRLAHAFILTGVRGVGKTTTARLIARALNCVEGPTVEPCGVCDPCRAIAEGRHVDVLEMDAASRTGVDDIREIIDGVQYAPVAARFKIYLIDEVHMLSRNAFNALLKTLEEPPEHVKFLFATTEIRKLPVTVLSRCQRFDLKRVDAGTLVSHLSSICEREAAEVDEPALRMIARAAEGSVRDALSLLDQAIAHGAGKVDAEQVRDMLGLADRAEVLDLTRSVMAGDLPAALDLLERQYAHGADPAVILSDMLEVVHWLTRLKVAPGAASAAMPDGDVAQAREMAEGLAMPHLTRAWQMLLKGLTETRNAPDPLMAAEMALIRLACAADLPDPAELMRRMDAGDRPAGGAAAMTSAAPPSGATPAAGPAQSPTDSPPDSASAPDTRPAEAQAGATVLALHPEAVADEEPHDPVPQDFEALVALFFERREAVLATALKDDVRLVAYRPGYLEINAGERFRPTHAGRVRDCLKDWTGLDWQVVLSGAEGMTSLREQERAAREKLFEQAREHPLVASAIAAFPGADLREVRRLDAMPDATLPGEEE